MRHASSSLEANAPLERRIQAGAFVLLFAIALVGGIELVLRQADAALLATKVLQGGGLVLLLLLVRRGVAGERMKWLAGATLLWVNAGAAVSGIARHEVALGTYLAAATCLGAAAVVPWGARVQAVVVSGTMALLGAAWWVDGRADWVALLGVLPTVPISMLIAAEVAGYRSRQVRTDATLRESEARFRQVVERVGEVFWLGDLHHRLLYVSPAYDDIWGRPRAAMLADPRQWEAALHPSDRERARALPPSLVGDDADREYRIVRPDGTVRWIIDRAFPIRDASGRIYRRAAIARDVTAIHDAAETTALRDLAAKIEAAREEERQHVAREIHDVLAQVLTGLKLHLASLSPCIGDPAQERLQASTAAVDAAIGVVRRLATSLRPVLLDDLGLVEALRSHARQFSARTEIGCELDLPAIAPACGAERATALFRIFDEALSNVARHAGASQVWVHLTMGEGDMTLRVDDDGRGFAAGELSASRALGLLAMRERARVFGGTVEVTGAPGRGTSVVARLRLDVH